MVEQVTSANFRPEDTVMAGSNYPISGRRTEFKDGRNSLLTARRLTTTVGGKHSHLFGRMIEQVTHSIPQLDYVICDSMAVLMLWQVPNSQLLGGEFQNSHMVTHN